MKTKEKKTGHYSKDDHNKVILRIGKIQMCNLLLLNLISQKCTLGIFL